MRLTLEVPFDREHVTFATELQKAGYHTGVVGKWPLVTEPAGFDYYNVLPGQGEFFNPRMKEIGEPWTDGNRGGINHDGYVTDVITYVALPERERKKAAYQHFIKAYLRCVASIDENVGRVLDYLDDNGLTENTIVVYTSDQGFFLGEHGMFDKRFMYE